MSRIERCDTSDSSGCMKINIALFLLTAREYKVLPNGKKMTC